MPYQFSNMKESPSETAIGGVFCKVSHRGDNSIRGRSSEPMMHPLFRRRHGTALLAALGITAMLFAHDGDLLMVEDALPTYTGPGWTLGSGTKLGETFPSSGIELLSWITVPQFGAQNTSANTVEGYVSPSGREYAVIGLSDGTGFVEVTDPGNPVIVGFISSVESLWRDVRVYQDRVYTVSEAGGGIQVIDVSQIDSGTVSLVGNVSNDAIPESHTLFVNAASGYLYRCGGNGTSVAMGVRIYNLANPSSPAYVTTVNGTRYIHECQAETYTSGPYAGKEILFCYSDANSGGGTPALQIFDVTNKAAVVTMGSVFYPQSQFSHQGWLSADKQYVYLDDELDERNLGLPTGTRVINVSNLNAPSYVGSFGNGGTAIDHNLYTKNNLIFQSNYRSGLRVFDATNPTNPAEIAYFDTYPPDDNALFNSLWDNYPYLPSGIVLGSDIEKGLFVWSVGPALLTFAYPDGRPQSISPAGDSVPVTITGNGVSVEPGTAKLHYSTGGPYVETDMVSTGGDNYDAVFPPIPCGTLVSYYVSAQTDTGTTIRNPTTAPTSVYTTTSVQAITEGFHDNMETNTGWTVGAAGDTATTGIWTRVDPIGTAAQPENDNPAGTGAFCWITGQGTVGGSVGEADVDNGTTTVVTPTLDASVGGDAYITYARWYSNNQGVVDDTMLVEISDNNGASWTTLEVVSENAGVWVLKSFRVADFVNQTSQVRIRFRASDTGAGSIVEAGVDDLRLLFYDCTPDQPGDVDGDGDVDVDDYTAVVLAWGNCDKPPCAADLDGDGDIDIDDYTEVILNWTP